MTCCFFGHSDTPTDISPVLEATITDLIERRGADTFYVGNHGGFDRIVRAILHKLSGRYPHIRCSVVLAYMPGPHREFEQPVQLNTVYPEGLEFVPKRFAISWRNKWMVQHCDIVVAYVTHSFGGAAQFVALARRQGKEIINLADSRKEDFK